VGGGHHGLDVKKKATETKEEKKEGK